MFHGPPTDKGEAHSAQNARRHGLTARELIIRDDERQVFEALRTDLTTELRPQSALEEVVFNHLVHSAWNLCRLRRLEAIHPSRAAVPALPAHSGSCAAACHGALTRSSLHLVPRTMLPQRAAASAATQAALALRISALCNSRNHSTELAASRHFIQSAKLMLTVENACCMKGK